MSTPLGKAILAPAARDRGSVIMDGSSIDGRPEAPLNLPPKTETRPFWRFSMRFRASHAVARAAFLGALLLAAWPCPGHAEDNPCFTGEGSVKEVIDACAAYIASGATDKDQLVRAHAVRAMAFSAIRDLDSALAELDEAIKVDATKPNSYFMRAAAHEARKDYEKALADLDEAIRLDAKHGDYYLLRGIVYRDKGDLDRALVEFNEKIKLDPDAAIGYSKRGDLYRQRKEYDLSVAEYGQVIKMEPESAKAYVDRGWVFVLKNDLDKAGVDFDKALELHNNDPAALVGRGVVKSRKGQPTDGSADLALAQKLEPGIFDEIRKLGIE
jgi:tetratricopeptide (TPR) repeat protein